jgi:hypothetical protein
MSSSRYFVCRRFSMRQRSTSAARQTPPAIVTASGCAPTHAAEPRGDHEPAAQVAAEVPFAGRDERLVGALHDALAADVDPRTGGHLAVHDEPELVEPAELVPVGPVADEVAVGEQHARRIDVGAEHADALARLHEHRLVGLQATQRREDLLQRLGVARRLAETAVDDELFGILGNLGSRLFWTMR